MLDRQYVLQLSLTGLIVISLLTMTLSNIGLYAIAQSQTFPNSIFASSSQAQLHELLLKATEENGLTNPVPGFSVDLTNVISTPINSELAIFTTDGSLSINEAKVTSSTSSFIDLVKESQNSFSLAGVPAGVYTVDVIAEKGNARAAYEGILVLGEDPTNTQTRTIIEQRIVEENDDDDDDGNNGNGGNGNCDRRSYPDVCIPRFPPDLDCGDITHRNFKVLSPDPHDFDREGDGIGCEAATIEVADNGQDDNQTLLPRDPCLEDPNLPECDPCIVNPDAEGCQLPPPIIDPCEEDPSLPECQEETGDDIDIENEDSEDSSNDENEDENGEDTGGDEGGGDEEAGADEE